MNRQAHSYALMTMVAAAFGCSGKGARTSSEPIAAGSGTAMTDAGGRSGFGQGSSSGTSSSGGTLIPDAARLVVIETSRPSAIDGTIPPPGTSFLIVTLELSCDIDGSILDASPAFFSMVPKLGGQPLMPSVLSTPNACNAALSVAVGAQVRCSLAFAAPDGELPGYVMYDDRRGDLAVAEVP